MIDHLFRCTVTWLAPMLCFTAEESWLSRYGAGAKSVHLEPFPDVPAAWRDDKLAEKWRKVRIVRRVVTGALEIERAQKRIGSSLEAHPIVHVSNEDLFEAVVDIDLAEVCITSAATLVQDEGPAGAFRLPDVPGVAVVPNLAEGTKCARSWKILTTIGADPRISGRLAARRPGAARMGSHAQGGGVDAQPVLSLRPASPASALRSRSSPALLDQASKLYLLSVFDLANGPVRLGPFFDFVLTRNTGISYGLFQTQGRSANGCCWASRRSPCCCSGSGWRTPKTG